jgi:sporulation protein YlmC with PRC-barrel domain
MLLVGSVLKGYAIQASDGHIGTVGDLLFDDQSWKIRWLVVDTGTWMTGRMVLVHPSAIEKVDHEARGVLVSLTKQKVKDSPDIMRDQPVSRQMQYGLYDYYGWNSMWGGAGWFGASPMMAGGAPSSYLDSGDTATIEREIRPDDGDPHLRSLDFLKGYHIHATDGDIGHVENFLVDDVTWDVRYLIVDTKNWWFGQHVLIAPFAVMDISWTEQRIVLNVPRDKVKASPPWDPIDSVEHGYEKDLHGYYNWPGYGW